MHQCDCLILLLRIDTFNVAFEQEYKLCENELVIPLVDDKVMAGLIVELRTTANKVYCSPPVDFRLVVDLQETMLL